MFDYLKGENYDVKFVSDVMPGASDIDVLNFSEREKRILITNDKDFGELIFRLKMPSSGVILLRLKLDSPSKRQLSLDYLFKNFEDKLFLNFVVVTESQVRVRKMDDYD